MVNEKEAQQIIAKINERNEELKNELKEMLAGNEEFIDAMFEKYVFGVNDIRMRKKREVVHNDERCQGIKKNGEKCSRRKLNGKLYCGTHQKHNGEQTTTEIEATVTDGIVEYIDPVSGNPIPVDMVLKNAN